MFTPNTNHVSSGLYSSANSFIEAFEARQNGEWDFFIDDVHSYEDMIHEFVCNSDSDLNSGPIIAWMLSHENCSMAKYRTMLDNAESDAEKTALRLIFPQILEIFVQEMEIGARAVIKTFEDSVKEFDTKFRKELGLPASEMPLLVKGVDGLSDELRF